MRAGLANEVSRMLRRRYYLVEMAHNAHIVGAQTFLADFAFLDEFLF